jgi:hypothetical protein
MPRVWLEIVWQEMTAKPAPVAGDGTVRITALAQPIRGLY